MCAMMCVNPSDDATRGDKAPDELPNTAMSDTTTSVQVRRSPRLKKDDYQPIPVSDKPVQNKLDTPTTTSQL